MEHREYLATIGRTGGKKRAQHPKRVEFAKRAAKARWKKQQVEIDELKRRKVKHFTVSSEF